MCICSVSLVHVNPMAGLVFYRSICLRSDWQNAQKIIFYGSISRQIYVDATYTQSVAMRSVHGSDRTARFLPFRATRLERRERSEGRRASVRTGRKCEVCCHGRGGDCHSLWWWAVTHSPHERACEFGKPLAGTEGWIPCGFHTSQEAILLTSL